MNIASWILRLVIAAAFLMAAISKLARLDGTAQQFVAWGFPSWTVVLVALVELFGAAGLLFTRTVQAASGILILLLVGALYTHFAHEDPVTAALPAVALLILLGFSVLLQRRRESAIDL